MRLKEHSIRSIEGIGESIKGESISGKRKGRKKGKINEKIMIIGV